MQAPSTPILGIHRFLSQQLFYPLVLSTLLVGATWVARVYFGHTWTYAFFVWNLFLAWIPYGFSLLVAALDTRWPGRWWLLPIPFLFWLVFFPNAPYIITDLLHLEERGGAPMWYDIGMFAIYAWTGCFLAVVSLNTMQGITKRYIGSAGSWLFVASIVILSGLGIYLGRFLNWNSWDLLTQPQLVLGDLVHQILHPIRYARIYGVTLMFASFLLVCYLTFVSVERRAKSLYDLK